jgi:hypothetical protein
MDDAVGAADGCCGRSSRWDAAVGAADGMLR